MTKRYYYTDPLKAAWMCQNFNFKITAPVNNICSADYEQSRQSIPMWLWGRYIEKYAQRKNDFKYHIMDNCHELLKPQIGDYGGNGDYSGIVNRVDKDGVGIILPYPHGSSRVHSTLEYSFPIEEFILEKRNGKAFFTCECEEAQ